MPMYQYECTAGHEFEDFRPMSERGRKVRCTCGKYARKVVTACAIHTLETHLRGTRGIQTACDGSYVDDNLFDRRTGKAPVVTSLKHKRELMKAKGVDYAEPPDHVKDFLKEKGRT